MNNLQVAIIIGSLRKESINRQLANGILKLAPEGVRFKIVEIGDLPLYNQDDDANQADAVKQVKADIAQSDGVLFVTPEHNRAIPAALKNVLDHVSRPPGQNAWAKKPAAIIGLSPSAVGTALAQQNLRAILATLDMPTLCQPEMFLQIKDGFFDDNGNIGAGSNKFIKGWVDRVCAWIKLNKAN